MTAAPLEIVGELPKTPLLVIGADTLALVETYATEAKVLAIATPEQADMAATLLRNATDLAKTLEARRVEVKRPFKEMAEKVDAAVKAPYTRLLAVINDVRAEISDWNEAEEDRRRREEGRRQAELRQLEQRRLAEEAEARRLEAERLAAAAADIPPVDDDLSDLAEEMQAEKVADLAEQQAALQVARPAEIAKPVGITYRVSLGFEISNLAALPSTYAIKTPNNAAIRRDFCNGWKEGDPLPLLSGVRFWVEKQPVLAGRR